MASYLPPTSPWVRTTCLALLGAYVAELVLRLAQLPVDQLAWWPMAFGFQPWQPLTRLAVQGGDPGVVLRVVFGLLVLWFGAAALDRRRLAQAVGAAWLGGSGLGLGLDALGALSGGPTFGWTPLLGAVLLLFGLQHPDRQVLLYFALPIPGRALVWGTGGIALLMFLAQRSLGTADALGGWLGVWAWWSTLGPGGARRRLLRRGAQVERQIGRLRVIPGGRSERDPWVH